MLCYTVLAMGLCLSRARIVLKWLYSGFWHTGFPQLILHCLRISKNKTTSFWNFIPDSWLIKISPLHFTKCTNSHHLLVTAFSFVYSAVCTTHRRVCLCQLRFVWGNCGVVCSNATYQKMLAVLAQCETTMMKSVEVYNMNLKEQENYERLNERIGE